MSRKTQRKRKSCGLSLSLAIGRRILLTCPSGEQVWVRLTYVDDRTGRSVKLNFDAPDSVRIMREKLIEA